MERLIVTEDGSHSLYSTKFNQQYHSLQGALSESEHIYINLGLKPFLENSAQRLSVLEMGLGTALNAFLAWKFADRLQKPLKYLSLEAYPISEEEAAGLNYEQQTGEHGLQKLHSCAWSVYNQISPYFSFKKENTRIEDYVFDEQFNVIFYDAFDPRAQPELWTEQIFAKIAAQTCPGGVLVTYSSKGIVKRALRAAGFVVERHPGPGRKTHILNAIKPA